MVRESICACGMRVRMRASSARRHAMPLRDSEAIILQSYPLGEADRLVSFLSRSMGRMRGVAAGALKPKSRFGSTLERLSHVRIWFYERETRELVRINQCELIESFVGAFRDYESSVALNLLAEITEVTAPEREPSDPTFRLLLLAAQQIKQKREVDLPLAYFTLWTLRLGGWLAPLDRCARCGRELGEGAAYENPQVPGFSCSACRGTGMCAISLAARIAARRMLAERLDKIPAAELQKTALRELTKYLLDLLEHQTERKLVSREMLESPL
jgi:DNA repair protein RecO (recombination protein O)